MDRLFSVHQSISRGDVVDIIVLTIIFFGIFTVLRESRSFTALRGLAITIALGTALWITATAAGLTATRRMLEGSLTLVFISFVILFQNELKKALTDFGQASFLRPLLQTNQFDIDEVIKAVVRMSERKIGALIAIERRNSLNPYIEVGTPIDGVVSAELLRTIFALQTPLHDGAVIVRNNRIAAAGCLLPLSENPKLSKDLGTRHRAGIGVTQETDAIAIVCSEETGLISLCYDGRIDRGETPDSLRTKLKAFLDQEDAADD